jgi:hypothetical protein
MSVKEAVRARFEHAERTGNREEKNLLSGILDYLSTADARTGKEMQRDSSILIFWPSNGLLSLPRTIPGRLGRPRNRRRWMQRPKIDAACIRSAAAR